MTQELKINETLPVLSFNYDDLKTWAIGLTERYTDLVVTEDAVADVKRDMAELNKNKARLEEARKETARRLSEPLRSFETQIKEICGIFDTAYAKLGGQVKAFEDAQREEKRNTVEGIVMSALHNAFGPFGPGKPSPLQIPIHERWLNKTTTLKTIREDIAVIIQRRIEDEQRKAAIEQARRDRAAAIESHVNMLNQQHGLNISVSRFITQVDLSIPLETVLSKITLFFEYEKKNKAALRKEAAPAPAPLKEEAPQAAPAARLRIMSVILEFNAASEAQILACLDNLKPLCVKFGARYR